MTTGNATSGCPIMELPAELRGLIIRWIPQNESLNLRLVCRQWNSDVDNHFHFDIQNLNESSTNFQQVLSLRMKTLKMNSSVKTAVLNPDGTCVFKYPNAIRKLQIAHESQLNLLQFCNKNLQELHLTLGNVVCPTDLPYDFRNLKSLEFEICITRPELVGSPTKFFQQLTNSSLPRLRHLQFKALFLKLEMQPRSQLIINLCRLIAKHGRDLETLHLYFDIYRTGGTRNPIFGVDILSPGDLTFTKNEVESIMKLDKLKYIFISSLHDDMECGEFWQPLISNQTNLINVNIEYGKLAMSSNLCRNLVLNNFGTLAQVKIDILGVREAFDLSVFQSCLNLEVLHLSIYGQFNGPREVRQCVNIGCLPPNIIRLKLFGFEILSHDLLICFGAETQLTKLQWLNLTSCGRLGEVGVTITVLHSLLSSRNMELTYIEVGWEFNFSNVDETEKWVALLTRFGYPLVHMSIEGLCLEIKLTRESSDDEWHKNIA